MAEHPTGSERSGEPGAPKIKKRTIKMNLQDCYIEEDLFPKIFTKFEERIQNLQGRSRGDGI